MKKYIYIAISYILLIILGLSTVRYYKNKLEIAEQNLIASTSNTEQLKLKNGDLVATNNSYLLTIKELRDQFEMSKKEIRDLEKKLGDNLAYMSELKTVVKIDTIETIKDSIIYKDRDIDVLFNYKDKWTSFSGSTNINNGQSKTNIYDLNMIVPIKLGVMDNYKIFVQSDNPYVKFENIESAIVNGSKFSPKKKYWSWGVQGGIGINYDILTKNLGFGPQLGVGVQYNF